MLAKHGQQLSDSFWMEYVRCYSSTIFHPCGTCGITRVVDPELRVLGVQQLRVADSSVMPQVVTGNTNAACIMIGEKAAHMIALEHGLLSNKTQRTVGINEITHRYNTLHFDIVGINFSLFS